MIGLKCDAPVFAPGIERRTDPKRQRVMAPRATGHGQDLSIVVLVLQPAVLLVGEVFCVAVVVPRRGRLRHLKPRMPRFVLEVEGVFLTRT